MAKITTELDLELAKWNAKTAQVKAEMKAMSAAAKKESIGANLFGGISSQIGALVSGGAGLAALKGMLNELDDLADLSVKLGETPETLQRVGVAAQLSGSSVESLSAAMLKLERGLGDVENSKARDALARYGVDAGKLIAMPLDEKILVISEAFQRARDEGHGLADIQAMLGRGSTDLIPLLSMTGDELRAMFEGVDVLGNEAVMQMAELNDQVDLIAKNTGTWLKQGLVDFNAFIEAAVAAGMELAGVENAMAALRAIEDERKDATAAKMDELAETRKARGDAIADPFTEYDEKKDTEAQRRKRIGDLQREIESNRISMLPDDEQIAALGTKLEGVFKKLRDTADPFAMLKGGVKELMGLVGAMTADNPAYEDALKLVKEAQDVQQQISGLREKGAEKTDSVKTAALPGSVAAAINSIFGRSANELIVDETKRQTQVLERIDKGIQKLAEGGQNPFAEDDLFSFP